MARSVISPMSNAQGLALFDTFGRSHRPVHLLSVLNFAHVPPHPVWSRLATVRPTAAAADGGAQLAERLTQLSGPEQRQHVLDLVREQMATVLTLDSAGGIDSQRGFLDQGVDSLTAVELRNRLTGATGVRLPATSIFDHPTPAALTGYLLGQLAPAQPQEGADAGSPGAVEDEALVRRALAAIPLAQLREAGLLTALMRLADGQGAPQPVGGTPEEDAQESIDAMALDDLVQFALGDES